MVDMVLMDVVHVWMSVGDEWMNVVIKCASLQI